MMTVEEIQDLARVLYAFADAQYMYEDAIRKKEDKGVAERYEEEMNALRKLIPKCLGL